jgi:hypothetical protein
MCHHRFQANSHHTTVWHTYVKKKQERIYFSLVLVFVRSVDISFSDLKTMFEDSIYFLSIKENIKHEPCDVKNVYADLFSVTSI